jgi:antitoxin MazE
MRSRVQLWGNSLALRIPKSFALETALDAGCEVELTLRDGQLVITPVPAARYSLDDLLAEVTDENLHHETGTGPSVGSEAW